MILRSICLYIVGYLGIHFVFKKKPKKSVQSDEYYYDWREIVNGHKKFLDENDLI